LIFNKFSLIFTSSLSIDVDIADSITGDVVNSPFVIGPDFFLFIAVLLLLLLLLLLVVVLLLLLELPLFKFTEFTVGMIIFTDSELFIYEFKLVFIVLPFCFIKQFVISYIRILFVEYGNLERIFVSIKIKLIISI